MLHGRAQAAHGTCLLGSMPELRLRSYVAPRSSLARSMGKASGPPWSSSDDGEIKLMETKSSRRWQEQCWRARPWEPRRWIRRRAAAQGARDPGGGGAHGGEGGRFRGRRPEGRRAARIRDGGTRRSAVPRPRHPGEVARALPPSLAQLRRATAARDLTEREDGGKGERKKGAERGEGEKGRREWRKKE